jgi:hypothetical protein
MLAARMFPTTIWRRDRDSIDYTPEPDIFHDVFGRLPMYANTTLADFLERYGAICSHIEDPGLLERLGRLSCAVPALTSGATSMSLSNPDGQTYSFENALVVP